MSDVNIRKKQLLDRLKELDGRLHTIEEQLEHTNPDWEENATESEMDEMLESLGTAGATEVRAIKAALERIKKGTYGVCARCENDILPERLDVVPHTPFCKTCAREIAP